MTHAFARVGEHALQAATVHVPAIGPWWAEVVFEGAPDVSGRVSIWLGGLELVGTIDPTHDGVHGLQRRSRIVAGAGAWGTLLRARAYHNDAQLRARTIAEDAAREAGEQLGDFQPQAERIGIDYVRQAGAASRVLEEVIGDVAWWVGYDGRTHVGTREGGEASGYEILEVDPAQRVVTLAADELGGLAPGRTIDGLQLVAPLTLRELEITVTEQGLRVRAWCGGHESSRTRLLDALLAIVDQRLARRLDSVYRYRVVRMSPDRVELQVVQRTPGLPAAPGLPDVLPVSMWPGVAGAHAELAPGAEVLVQFIGGDRREPIITHFAGKDGVGWTPAHVVLSASSTLKLGSSSANDGVALSSRCNSRHDDVAAALDALCGATPVPNDGGAALQTAVKLAWSGATPGVPTPAANVGSTKVLAE